MLQIQKFHMQLFGELFADLERKKEKSKKKKEKKATTNCFWTVS